MLLPKHLFFDGTEISEKQDFHIKVGMSLKEMEEALIVQTLSEVNQNRTHAAKLLGISIRTLRKKINEYHLDGS